MAAPPKMGLDYFSFSVDLTNDEKLIAPRLKYGHLAIMVYIELLVIMYSDKGYYIDYREKDRVIWQLQAALQGGKNSITSETIESVISDLVGAGLFEAMLFKSGILTSARGQKTWYMATVARKIVAIDETIWLLSLNEMESLSSRHGLYVRMSTSTDLSSKSTNKPSKLVDLPFKVKESKGE